MKVFKIKNNRAEVANTLATIVVIIVLFFILGFGILYASLAGEFKKISVPREIESLNFNEVFFEDADIQGKSILLIDGLIEYYLNRDEERVLNEKINNNVFSNVEEERVVKERSVDVSRYATRFREELMKVLIEKNRAGEKKCFIAFFSEGSPEEPNWQIGRDMFFVVSKGKVSDGIVTELEPYHDAGLLNSREFVIFGERNNKVSFIQFPLQFYYGKCYSFGELVDLKKRRDNE